MSEHITVNRLVKNLKTHSRNQKVTSHPPSLKFTHLQLKLVFDADEYNYFSILD